jgi:hypothetical protein
MKWMMKILDTDSIQLEVGDRFDRTLHQDQIEAIAHEIVALQGLLSVVLVKKIDLEDYVIVAGHLEYFAYLKALEFDAALPDRIGVFVVESELVSPAKAQIEKLQSSSKPSQNAPTPSSQAISSISGESLQVSNLLKRLEQLENKMATTDQVNQVQSAMIVALDARIPKSLPMFEALDDILNDRTAYQVQQNLTRHLTKSKVEKVMNLLRSCREQGVAISSFSALKTMLENNKEQQKNRAVNLMSVALWMSISDEWQ